MKRKNATIDVGIAQTGSDQPAPWAVLPMDGGFVYPATRADGARWNIGDKVILLTSSENHAVLGALTDQPAPHQERNL